MIVPVSEWRPDLTTKAGDQTAENVIADADSYLPWPSLTDYSNSLSDRAQGAIAAIAQTRLAYNYAGDAKKLYLLADKSWTDASRTTSATYSTSLDQWWEFAQWGETIIATNQYDEPQEITLGATHFANLAGVPPQARHIAVVRDFVWLGNLLGYPQRVQWSAVNNSHSWTVDANTQADYQDLVGDGGHVQKIIGGGNALVFQERAIWRAVYVGNPAIFDFGDGPVERNLGAFAPQSVAAYGGAVFFLSEDGFRVFTGAQSQPIGAQKIDRTFLADLDQQYINRVQSIVDIKNKLYVCAYPGSGNTLGNPNKIMIYNFAVQRWTIVSEEVEMLFRHISTGYTLETLDTLVPAPLGIDDLAASLDSSLYAGGQLNLAAFNTGHMTALFTGTAKDATVDTLESEHLAGRRSKVNRARPLVDALASNITPITRNALAEAETVGAAIMQDSGGDCPIRTNARYHRYRIGTVGDFKHIQGVEVTELADGGSR